jgi:ribosomal protein S24E
MHHLPQLMYLMPQGLRSDGYSDVLHPNRANVSKEDLRAKLSEMYKVNKDQISVFGFRTQYGGGKSTGFGLIYDSVEAMKKFEPHYRLVRIGAATKIEKPSRQQRMFERNILVDWEVEYGTNWGYRQTTQEQGEDITGNSKDQGCGEEEGQEVDGCLGGAWGGGTVVRLTYCTYTCSPKDSITWRNWETGSSLEKRHAID